MKKILNRVIRKAHRVTAPIAARVRNGGHVAIIGAGRIAPTHIDAYQEGGLVTVQSICDISPRSLASTLDRYPFLRAFRDTEQMFEEVRPQIVSICTWPQSHLEMVKLAVENGVRGILCEKPLALSMADVDEMLRLCQVNNVKLAGGHQYRFHPNFVLARSIIDSGQLGGLQQISGAIQSSLANNGPHLFDTIRFLLNDRDVKSVACTCFRDKGTFDRGTPVEEGAEGRITFTDDINVEFSTGDRSTEFFEICIQGSKGKVVVTPSRLTQDSRTLRSLGKNSQQLYRRQQFAQFVKWVNGSNEKYPADGCQSAKTNELVLATYESARVGAELTMPLSNESSVLEMLYENAEPPTQPTRAHLSFHEVVPRNDSLAVDGGKRNVKSWFGSKPHLGKGEWTGVAKVLASGNLNSVSGSVVKEFERAVAKMYRIPGAVASTSGTASIHVALGILGLEPGDEVITTPITDMGSIVPILWCNCVPIFADIDPLTGNMTAETIERQITSRTRAVVLVHLFGRGAETVKIKRLLDEKGIVLIEDCSQAHLAKIDNELVGTIGDFGCFSLQQAKQITCGDGGFTLINSESNLHRARLFVDKGWNRRSGTRAHEFLGINYRMSELQGAVALAQLKKLPMLIESRRRTASDLSARLQSVPGIVLPTTPTNDSPSWWIYNFCIDESMLGVSPDIFAELLQVEGVRAKRNYLPRPIFEEDALRKQITYGTSRFPYSLNPVPQPLAEQMPGLQEFMARQMIVSWSSRVKSTHVSQIAEAISKVADVKFIQPTSVEASAATNIAQLS